MATEPSREEAVARLVDALRRVWGVAEIVSSDSGRPDPGPLQLPEDEFSVKLEISLGRDGEEAQRTLRRTIDEYNREGPGSIILSRWSEGSGAWLKRSLSYQLHGLGADPAALAKVLKRGL